MSEKLFLELYLDEDVSVLLAELIRARGFVAETTVEAGNLGKSDEEQLQYAINQEKVLLTHNRVDFENLAKEYFENGKNHYGIFIAVRRLPNQIAQRLLPILNERTSDEMKNQIVYI